MTEIARIALFSCMNLDVEYDKTTLKELDE